MKLLYVFLLMLSMSSCAVVNNETGLRRIVDQETTRRIVIKSDVDCQGRGLFLRKGLTLVFKGGSISNSNIVFDSVILKGKPLFKNCTYEGTILLNRIDDRNFTSYDDTGTFKFLVGNAIINGAKCNLYRDYVINMNEVSESGLISVNDLDSGAEIVFHNNTIYNSTGFIRATIKPVLVFKNVKKVTIRNCSFRDTQEHNSHLFKHSSGCTFLHCFGDCEAINILNCTQENGDCFLRSGVYTHNNKYYDFTPSKGLSHSTIQIESHNTGYGLALYCGDNLDIDITANNPHRGLYCAGVSNSSIRYRGYNPVETKCHILLKDAVFRKFDRDGRELLDMRGCHNLQIIALLNEVKPNESLVDFSSYGSGKKEGADFTFRTEKCIHSNIDISAVITHTPESGYFFISRFLSYGSEDDEGEKYGCKAIGIRLHDIICKNGESRPYMCKIDAGIDADIVVENCQVTAHNQEMGYGYDYIVKGNSMGKITINNTLIGNVLVRDKRSEEFNIEVTGKPMTRSLNYLNDNSSKSLVHIKNR